MGFISLGALSRKVSRNGLSGVYHDTFHRLPNNIKHIQNATQYKDRFHVTIDTIFNEEKMTELIGTCGVVIHLAAAVGVKYIG